MNFSSLRRLAIVSMFADDDLMEMLVLKGGNALGLVHGIGSRSSLDLDFSMAGDFPDLEWAERRLTRSLKDRFDSAGYLVFDTKLAPKPQSRAGRLPHWGGYHLDFKVIGKDLADELGHDLARMRRQAVATTPAQHRILQIQISHHEHVEGKVEAEVDGYTIYVYPPVMIAIEKLRAICQQMDGYRLARNPSPRARDFYDICSIVDATGLELTGSTHWPVIRAVFGAKEVPLRSLAEIGGTRDFHQPDWASVENSVHPPPGPFGGYFDRVVEIAGGLHPLWEE